MCADRPRPSLDVVLGNAEFAGGIADDFGEFGIMDVADIGKEVVFHLVVQAADQPSQETAAGSKIGGGDQLGVE